MRLLVRSQTYTQPVVRQPHAVHRVVEARRWRRAWIVGRQLVVDRRLGAVGAPVPLVGAGLHVEHDHAAVAVAVRHVDLARRVVGHHVRRTAEPRRRVRALAAVVLADLLDELAVGRELQDLVAVVVAADPDVAGRVDVDAVLVLDPVSRRPVPRTRAGCRRCRTSAPRALPCSTWSAAGSPSRLSRRRAASPAGAPSRCGRSCRRRCRTPGRGSSFPAVASARTARGGTAARPARTPATRTRRQTGR